MKTSEQDNISRILKDYRTVAVVGLSRDSEKDSHRVASYLKTAGYRIIPVNPSATEILGENVYKELLDLPEEIDVVDIFRPADEAVSIVKKAIEKGVKAVWMQVGRVNEEAARIASDVGLDVVMDRDTMVEHMRFVGK